MNMPPGARIRDIVLCWSCCALAMAIAAPTIVTPCRAQDDTAQAGPEVGQPAGDEVSAAFSVEASTVFALQIGQTASASLHVTIPIEGKPVEIELLPHSVRADDYTLLIQQADGSYQEVEPGPIRTLRGSIPQVEDSVVAASLTENGLRARIILPDDTTYWVEPLGGRVAGTASDQHVVYRNDDVIPCGGECLALHPPIGATAAQTGTGSVATGGLYIAQLAVDTDYEYFMDFQGADDPVAATEARIIEIVNAVNVQYERDVAIRHVIGTMIIRTSEPDPYEATDALALLDEFKHYWRDSLSYIVRDVAQLFTGKNLDSNTIGIAWVGTVCSDSWGYSVVESNCTGCSNFSCKTDLSAHELGHNWDADHCGDEDGVPDCYPSCPEHTMNCSLRCANQFHEILTIPEIITFRDSRSCLDEGDELRRLVMGATSQEVPEGGTLQFTAIADFRFGDDLVVTSEATWWVDRPEAGSIDSDGLFTAAADVDGNLCVTVSASYSFDDTTRENSETIVVLDTDAPLSIEQSWPPDGSIDARQPSQPDGADPTGWQMVDITFSGDTCLMIAGDFAVGQDGGDMSAPTIVDLEHTAERSVRVMLSRIVESGTWTTVTHIDTGLSTRLGCLPGDVNADETAAPADILAVIDVLNGVGDPGPIWSTDVDRSGAVGPPDILRVIDLLNGAGVYQPWNNRSLP